MVLMGMTPLQIQVDLLLLPTAERMGSSRTRWIT